MSTFASPGDSIPASGVDLLFSTTLTSDATDIDSGTLSALADYRDVRCVLRDIRSDRSSTSSGVRMYINNDQTGTNYGRAYLEWGDAGGAGVSGTSATSSFISTIPAASEDPIGGLQARNGIVVDILSINSALPKQYMIYSGRLRPHSVSNDFLGYIRVGSYYGSTSAITRIVFADSNGDDLLAGASLSIYGIR